jgi:hypothetical protein
MVEKLIAALRALAAPGPEHAGELALEYADAWLTARQCPGLEFTAEQVELLDEIDSRLDRSSGPDGALSERVTLRAFARNALASLGQKTGPPDASP